MKLLIVESPNKAKKIQTLLGSQYKVVASAGHFRDLPVRKIGVEGPDYRPKYEVTNARVVKTLKGLVSQASSTILATDLDREGEAIAWHLEKVLGLKNPPRVTFAEVTKAAITKALSSPRRIDYDMVSAQEARRVLDRLVGYKVSGPLGNMTGQNVSAGRVQSPALRLVVERERAIRNFVPVNHFGVAADLQTDGVQWGAAWNFKPLLSKQVKEHWLDRTFAEKVRSTVKSFQVQSVDRKETSRKAPAPFTTSTMQQGASVALRFGTQRTMQLAQKLFEEGLISYHRTDSPNLSDEAIQAIWGYLKKQGLSKQIPDQPNRWKSKAGSQEAHEAIRPTDINKLNPNVDPDALKLYRLIWQRAVASQMAAARYDVTRVVLKSIEPVDGKTQEFVANGRVLTFDGWLRISNGDAASENKNENDQQSLPKLKQGQSLTADKLRLLEKVTKPPNRYTEASLVKKLEEEGIGRPSTYASIFAVLFRRPYIKDDKRKLVPTQLGEIVIDALENRFAFAELGFTRDAELQLDQIASGKAEYRAVVQRIDTQLDLELAAFQEYSKTVPTVAPEHPCPTCGLGLRRLKGKQKGFFWACPNREHPLVSDKKGTPGDPIVKRVDDPSAPKAPCPEDGCSELMILRESTNKAGFFYWACPNRNHSLRFDDNGQPGKVMNFKKGSKKNTTKKPSKR